MTLHAAWWHVPATITILALLAAFLWPDDSSGDYADIGRAFSAIIRLLAALGVITLTWILAAILK